MVVIAFGARDQLVFLNVLITAEPALVMHRAAGPNHPETGQKKRKQMSQADSKAEPNTLTIPVLRRYPFQSHY